MPRAFKLKPSDFKEGLDYVKAFIKEVRVLHRSDVKNEERKAKCLSMTHQTENLQPECLRGRLTNGELFLTGVVPILREDYKANLK